MIKLLNRVRLAPIVPSEIQNTLKAATSGMILVDPATRRVVTLNDAARKLFGYAEAASVTPPVGWLVPELPDLLEGTSAPCVVTARSRAGRGFRVSLMVFRYRGFTLVVLENPETACALAA